ncbi:MAG: GHKL domain-containing protein [Lachnospiraceae bacterium]|nr:GHKL domain-containing protein [Lachnospiraceae bacterium]
MNGCQIISYFFTNGLRIFVCLYLVIAVLKVAADWKKAGILSALAAVLVTVLSALHAAQIYVTGAEIILIIVLVRYLIKTELRMPLFLTFFYEITVLLWEFMASAYLGILFQSERFLNKNLPEYMAAVWVVRLLMLSIILWKIRADQNEDDSSSSQKEGQGINRMISGIAVAGIFGVVFLSGQNVIAIEDEEMTTWIIFAMLILVAVLLFYLGRQYEMEKKVAQLEKERNDLLLRDYRLLKDTYAANARLFHDFHNHIEALHRYLVKEKTAEAVQYLEGLRTPIEAVTQAVWTRDEAADYLLSSRQALAASREIQIRYHIEYPRHTNIRSVDLVAILGNLLDNAFEAVEDTEGNLRFVELTVRRIHEMLIIKLVNGCKAAPVIAEGEVKTTKQDKNLHGWGLKSIRTAAEYYDGTVETEYENNRFCTVVTLSFEPVKAV